MRVVIAATTGVLMAVFGCAFAAPAHVDKTGSGQKVAPAEANLQSFVWYDGDQRRTVYMDPALVAEFTAPSDERSAVKSAFPNARQMAAGQTVVRIWKLSKPVDSSRAMSVMQSAATSDQVSPVFRDLNFAAGPKRALPGNVIVYLDPAWGEARIQQWLGRQELKVVRRASWGDNVYIIKTGAGLDALETANRLYQSGEVLAASPDWWVEVETK